MPRRISQEQIDQIRSMTEHRETQSKIAETVGVTTKTVRTYQMQFDLPASNRHGDGKDMHSAIPPVFNTNKVEAPKRDIFEHDDWIIVANKIVSLVGVKTNYVYEISLKGDSVSINTGYNEMKIEIDIKDLVAFGNELLDVAEKITEMKKNVWRV